MIKLIVFPSVSAMLSQVINGVTFFTPKSDGVIQVEGRPFLFQCIFDASEIPKIDLSKRTVIWRRPGKLRSYVDARIDDNSRYGNITLYRNKTYLRSKLYVPEPPDYLTFQTAYYECDLNPSVGLHIHNHYFPIKVLKAKALPKITTSMLKPAQDEESVELSCSVSYSNNDAFTTRSKLKLALIKNGKELLVITNPYKLGTHNFSYILTMRSSTDDETYTCQWTLKHSNDELRGQSFINNCNPGYMFSFNQSDCVPCPKNTYQPMKGQIQCNQCPHGTTTYTDDLHVYINDCKEECRPGYSFNMSEMVCKKCPRNSTQENKGHITCDVCPINLPITEKEGTVFQSDCIQNCNAGSYFNKTTLSCMKCKRNSYQPQTGKTKCLTCGMNKITIETGAIDKTQCIKGSSRKSIRELIKTVIPYAIAAILFPFCILVLCYLFRRRMKKNKKMTRSGNGRPIYQRDRILNQDNNSETNLNDPTNISGNEFMLQSRSQQSQNPVYEEPRCEPENHSNVVKISFEPRPLGYEEPIIVTIDKSPQNQSVDQCENSSVRDSMINEDNGERYTSLILAPGCRNDLENNDYQPLLKNGNVTNGESVDQYQNTSVRDSMINEDNGERYTSLILAPDCKNDFENNDYQPLLKNGNVTNDESVDQYQNSFVSDLMIDEEKGEQYKSLIKIPGTRHDTENDGYQPLLKNGNVKNGERVDQYQNFFVSDLMIDEEKSEQYKSLIKLPGNRNDAENDGYQPLLKNGDVTNGKSVDEYRNSSVSNSMINEDKGEKYLTIIE